MSRAWHALAVPLLVVVSGCLDLEELHEGDSPGEPGGPTVAPGRMTGSERQQDTVAACPGTTLQIPPPDPTFCATRKVFVTGEMDLEFLPLTLTTFNGAIDVQPTSAREWNLTATLTVRGDSESEARSRLDLITFTWSHEAEGGHRLLAHAKHTAPADGSPAAAFTARLPGIPIHASLTTSNGRIQFTGFEAPTTIARTSNGEIVFEARGEDATLSTSNGKITAEFRPTADGAFHATSSNGDVALELAEDGTHGHHVTGTTSNGDVTISLKDGSTTGSKTHKEFTTNSYGDRSVKTTATLRTSNGDVVASPA